MKRILALSLAVGLALVAQEVLHRRGIATDAVALYLPAVAIFCWAAWRWPGTAAPDSPVQPADASQGHWRIGRRDLAVPAAAVVPMFIALAVWRLNGFSGDQSTHALLVYAAGLILFCYGTFSLGKAEGAPPPGYAPILSRRCELLAVAAILMLGAFMVFYRLDSLPFGVWYDEADSALEAVRILDGAPYSPVAHHFTYNPSLFFYYLALVFRVFGAGLLQLRIATAVLALLAIPAIYVLGRAWFGPRVALLAAVFMAVSRWHIDFARWGIANTAATAIGILAFHFLYRGLRSRRWADLAWAGLLLGLGMHTCTAFRLMAVAVLGSGLVWILMAEIWPRAARRDWQEVRATAVSLGTRLGLVVVTMLIALGPLALFAVSNPEQFNQRVEQTSVFARKETTEQKVAALRSNIEKHLLMFNYRGDGNGRHNLPGEPMLDPTVGAFFVLGLAWSLTRLRDPLRVSLLLWLVVAMMGGVLSLDFEAPQAIRTLAAVPVVCLLAALPLAHVWEAALDFARSWALSPRGLRFATAAVCVLVAAGLARAAYANGYTYFVRQANDYAVWSAYSAAETIAARRANELGSGYTYYLANFMTDHPTLRFLAPWLKGYQTVSSDMIFPLYKTGDRPVAIFLDAQKTTAFNAGRRYYPTGSFVQHAPPFGGAPVLYEMVLQPSDILAVQGVTAGYFQGTDWQGQAVLQRKEPRVDANWRTNPPLSGPFSVEWQGTLYSPLYGQYVLALTAPAGATLLIDETEVLNTDARGGSVEKVLALAKGNHALRLRAVGAAGELRLAWQPPGGARATVPQEALYVPPVAANGLLGSYFRSTDWSGSPAVAQVDPSLNLYFHQPLLPRPYTVEWRGKIDAPAAGSYAFGLESIDDSWLYLDDRLVTEAHVPNQMSEGRLTLTQGLHDIRVRLLDKSGYSHINLFWTVPGRGREAVPSERLYPPQGAYPTPAPSLPLPAATPAPVPTALPGAATRPSPLRSVVVLGGEGGALRLVEPRDVAVNSRGDIYVADTGSRQVVVLDGAGRQTGILPGEMEEPLAIVVDSSDNAFVLDSATGWIYRFDSTGAAAGRLGGPAAQFYHPRGMGIDRDSNLYVADTGGGRIVKLAPDGTVVAKFGSRGSGPGQFTEPVDVVVDSAGRMYVADVGNRRVVRLDSTGGHLGEWSIPPSVAYNGIHLALTPSGSVLATDPEGGRLLTYDSSGRLVRETGRRGVADGEFSRPVGIFAASDGRVYTADPGDHRVQIFAEAP